MMDVVHAALVLKGATFKRACFVSYWPGEFLNILLSYYKALPITIVFFIKSQFPISSIDNKALIN
jgi:hypothetical protein